VRQLILKNILPPHRLGSRIAGVAAIPLPADGEEHQSAQRRSGSARVQVKVTLCAQPSTSSSQALDMTYSRGDEHFARCRTSSTDRHSWAWRPAECAAYGNEPAIYTLTVGRDGPSTSEIGPIMSAHVLRQARASIEQHVTQQSSVLAQRDHGDLRSIRVFVLGGGGRFVHRERLVHDDQRLVRQRRSEEDWIAAQNRTSVTVD